MSLDRENPMVRDDLWPEPDPADRYEVGVCTACGETIYDDTPHESFSDGTLYCAACWDGACARQQEEEEYLDEIRRLTEEGDR